MSQKTPQAQTTSDLEALLGPIDRKLLLKLLDALIAEQGGLPETRAAATSGAE